MALREREKITLIGRRNELDGMLSMMGPGPQRAPLIIVSGPGGIGKSTLVSEAVRVARNKGQEAAAAVCGDGSPYPYAPFHEIAGLLTIPPTSVKSPFLDKKSMNSKDGMLIAWETFLSERSRARPLLLVLEDLQHADSSTLRLLSYLIRSLRKEQVQFLCSYCPEKGAGDGAGTSIHHEFLSGALRDGVCRKVELGGLSPDDIAKLLHGTFQQNLPKNVVDKASRNCQGNPLLAIEMIRSLDSSGSMDLRDGVLRCDRLGPLPSTVGEAVKNRLAGLNDRQLQMLYSATSFEDCTDISTLAEALKGGPEEIADIIDEVHRKSDLIDRLGNRYFFPHERVRRAINDLVPPQEIRGVHRSVAETLDGKAGPDKRIGELSSHWLRAEDNDRCIRFSLLSGRACSSSGAHIESILYFGRALRLAEGSGQMDVLLEASEAIGDANEGLGSKNEAMSYYDKAMRYSASSDRARILRKKSQCVGTASAGKGNDASLSLVLQALIEAGDEYETAECKSSIARAVVQNGDMEGAEKLSLAAMKVFKDRGTVDRLAEEMLQYGDLLLRIGKVDQAIETLSQAVRMVNEHPDLVRELDAAEALAMAYLYKGEMGKAAELFDHCLDLSERTGDGGRAATVRFHKSFASGLIRNVPRTPGAALAESTEKEAASPLPEPAKSVAKYSTGKDAVTGARVNDTSAFEIDQDSLATGTLAEAFNASLLGRKRDYERSNDLFQQTLEKFSGRRFGPLYEAAVRAWFAESLAEQGRTDRALEEFRRSRTLFEGFGNSLIIRILDQDIDKLAYAKTNGNEDS